MISMNVDLGANHAAKSVRLTDLVFPDMPRHFTPPCPPDGNLRANQKYPVAYCCIPLTQGASLPELAGSAKTAKVLYSGAPSP